MKILGIDPGFDGGFVQIDEEGKLLKKYIMPVLQSKSGGKNKRVIDEFGLLEIFEDLKDSDHVFLEKVQSMPNQGVTSTFTFGEGYGILRGMLIAYKMNYTLVRPLQWTRIMHLGISKGLDSKKRSLITFQRSYNYDFRATSRCKKQHSGLVDAILIAEYGRRVLK